ncbi:DUF3489 domain-containing protein [Erythrobacter sp. sf7]|uniref:DUF3489 domain-containing protein n=1 Tax=Erythrobacter fulvus TaxID=2987523 RepID=A0ABT5JQU5_9SPHN|nr:DUF3489 domain-containing protein [Erythrobacter fulvus]MDC8754770.1 DUF3489 domain-containing protein [Erythrobacter fulvus]
MTNTNTAVAKAAPATESADPVNASKTSGKRLTAPSEADKKPAEPPTLLASNKKARSIASATASAPSEASHAVPEQQRKTKASVVEALLTREGGASLEALSEATGWQAHTCRAFLTGLRKKGREVIRASDKDGKSIYLITPDRSAPSPPKAKQTVAESN